MITVRRGNNVSATARRFWTEETKDIKYMPQIAHLENRGADSILQVLHLNNIHNEFDTTIQFSLWNKILIDLTKDPIWDKQTLFDYIHLLPYYMNAKKSKVYLILNFVFMVINGVIRHVFKYKSKKNLESRISNILTCSKVTRSLDSIYSDLMEELSIYLKK